MTLKMECVRCGAQAEVKNTTVVTMPPFVTMAAPLFREVPPPEGWRRPVLPRPDGSAWKTDLCGQCVNALYLFLEGDGAVPGLLEHDALAAAEQCSCPKPQQPVPPCPVHAVDPEDEPEPEHEKAPPEEDGGREHEHLFVHSIGSCRCGATYEDVLARTEALNAPTVLEHDTPECPFCPSRGFQLTNEHVRVVHPERWEEWAELEGVDPRPNLTARAEKIASGRIPVGQMTATCPEGDGRCSGLYERGQLHEHMAQCHGVRVAAGTEQCPYCTDLYPGPVLGRHVASEHPGEWESWRSREAVRERRSV